MHFHYKQRKSISLRVRASTTDNAQCSGTEQCFASSDLWPTLNPINDGTASQVYWLTVMMSQFVKGNFFELFPSEIWSDLSRSGRRFVAGYWRARSETLVFQKELSKSMNEGLRNHFVLASVTQGFINSGRLPVMDFCLQMLSSELWRQ